MVSHLWGYVRIQFYLHDHETPQDRIGIGNTRGSLIPYLELLAGDGGSIEEPDSMPLSQPFMITRNAIRFKIADSIMAAALVQWLDSKSPLWEALCQVSKAWGEDHGGLIAACKRVSELLSNVDDNALLSDYGG